MPLPILVAIGMRHCDVGDLTALICRVNSSGYVFRNNMELWKNTPTLFIAGHHPPRFDAIGSFIADITSF